MLKAPVFETVSEMPKNVQDHISTLKARVSSLLMPIFVDNGPRLLWCHDSLHRLSTLKTAK